MRMTPRGTAVAAIVVMAATAVSGCSAQSSADVRAISPESAASEYRAEQPVLKLAPGWAWPQTVAYAETGPDGAGMLYQKGFGTTQADHYWYCGWERRLVDGNATGADLAETRRQLQSVRRTHMYTQDIIEVDRPLFNKILDTALDGDLDLMRRDVRLNCPKSTLPLDGTANWK